MDGLVHRLCHALEKRLSFLSLEDIALRQLKTTRAQVEEFRLIGTELVADLGRPLREELPQAISRSIATAMGPLVDGLMRSSSSGIEGMVGSLSDQLSGSVGAAMGEAAGRLGAAGERLAGLVGRMEAGAGRMGAGMEGAVAGLAGAVAGLRAQADEAARATAATLEEGSGRLLAAMTASLDGIRENTAAGAVALREAAADLLSASQGIRAEMEGASREGAEAVRARMTSAGGEAAAAVGAVGADLVRTVAAAGADIERLGREMSDSVGREVIGRVEAIAARLEDMGGALGTVVAEVGRLGAGVRAGADGAGVAAEALGRAGRDLREAVDPILASHAHLEGAVKGAADGAQRTAEVLRLAGEGVRSDAAATLEAAREGLRTAQKGVEATLLSLQAAIAAMRGQGERIDLIDEKLGRAFEQYRSHVEGALGTAVDHARRMHDILSPGIATLQQVVEQAEEFRPRGPRAA